MNDNKHKTNSCAHGYKWTNSCVHAALPPPLLLKMPPVERPNGLCCCWAVMRALGPWDRARQLSVPKPRIPRAPSATDQSTGASGTTIGAAGGSGRRKGRCSSRMLQRCALQKRQCCHTFVGIRVNTLCNLPGCSYRRVEDMAAQRPRFCTSSAVLVLLALSALGPP